MKWTSIFRNDILFSKHLILERVGENLGFYIDSFSKISRANLLQKNHTKKRGGKHLIEKETKIITHGEVDAKNLGEEEQRAFYISLLARVLELYREEKGKEVN